MSSYLYSTLLAGISALTLLVSFPFVAVGQTNQAGVQSADITAQLNQSGQLSVTEKITYDFSDDKRIGFARRLVVPQGGSVNVKEVTRDDLKEKYRVISSQQAKRIITGDQSIPLSGEHTYEISYTVDGVIQSVSGEPKLVWSVISDIKTEADNISVVLEASESITSAQCLIDGPNKLCPVERVNNGVRAEVEGLEVGDGLTIQSDVSEKIAEPVSNTSSGTRWWPYTLLVAILLGGLWVFFRQSFTNSEETSRSDTPDRIDTLR